MSRRHMCLMRDISKCDVFVMSLISHILISRRYNSHVSYVSHKLETFSEVGDITLITLSQLGTITWSNVSHQSEMTWCTMLRLGLMRDLWELCIYIYIPPWVMYIYLSTNRSKTCMSRRWHGAPSYVSDLRETYESHVYIHMYYHGLCMYTSQHHNMSPTYERTCKSYGCVPMYHHELCIYT